MIVNNKTHKNCIKLQQQQQQRRRHRQTRLLDFTNFRMTNMVNMFLLLLFVNICCLLQFGAAHVALTYPPARKYDLDFLDNSRTKGPCGMPKGSIQTSLLSGSKVNVTWHLAYPHRGGFRLQLLDALDRPVLDLTPHVNGSEFVRTDVTAQSFAINIPEGFECHNCTLRLLRQADEWSEGYRFWSCADVDVKNRKEFRESCSGHGKYFASRCKCDKNFDGPQCQYRNECSEDKECGAQGKCVDLQGTSLPRRQCYCNFGWHGLGCNKRSPYKTTELDLSAYSTKQLSPDYRMYWRLLEDQKEIEVVLRVNGTSWVGLGWRPRSLTKECKNFPLIRDIGDLTTTLEETVTTLHDIGSQAEPKSSAEPSSSAEPASKPEPPSSAEPSSKPEPPSSAEPSSKPEPPSTAEPSSKPEPPSSAEPSSKPEPSSSAEPFSKPEPPSTAEPSSKPEPPSTAEPASTPEPSSNPEPASTKSKRVAKIDDADLAHNMEGVTSIATSVSYSTKAGRERRQALETTTESLPLEPNSEAEPHIPSSTAEPSSQASEITSAPEPKPEPEPEPTSPEPFSKKSAALESQIPDITSSAEPISQPEPTSPEPFSKRTEAPETVPEPTSQPEPISKAEPTTQAEPASKPEPTSQAEPASKPEPTSQAEPASKPEPTSQAEPTSKPEPTSEAESSVKKVAQLSQTPDSTKYKLNPYTPIHDFNPMDCTDIVIGSARGNYSRVGDYYTRDRSTPRMDEFYGGKSDLSLGTGFEADGVTTIIFRKKLVAKELTDHTLDDELTHVIWAKGQEPGNYVHVPPSGIETEMARVKEFYQPDELKYHGHKMQRGVTQINFFEKEKAPTSADGTAAVTNDLDNECSGHWKYPSNCVPQDHTCEYYASWETVGRGDEMRWHIETTNTQTWTGIGFSDDERMSQTDAIIGWVDRNGRPFLMDTWIVGYSAPRLDDRQDIYNASGRIEKGVTILEFTRKRISNDEQDLSFTDDHCLYLFLPVLGGAFNSVNKKIRKHEQVPPMSSNRVCIKSCGKELDAVYKGPSTPAPNRLVYSVGIKLMNLAESFEAPQPGSVEYNNLAATILDSFNGILNDIPGYYKTEILGFEKEGKAMHAKVQTMFDKEAYEKGQALLTNAIADAPDRTLSTRNGDPIRSAIQDRVVTGKVGSLTVDPQYLDFEALEFKSTNNDETKLSFFELSEVRLYTVLGLIAALVLIALIQAFCTIYKTSRKSKSQKENLIQHSPWKEFNSNTNYAFDPYGETEEKITTTTTTITGKEKSRHQRSSTNNSGNSQQTTLPMSHSPTSKSQMYYESTGHGGGANGGTNQKRSSHKQNYDRDTDDYGRSNGRTRTSGGGGGPGNAGIMSNGHNSHYDRYERSGAGGSTMMDPQGGHYSRSSYADRAYSLPRHAHQQQHHSNMQPSGYYTQDRRAQRHQYRDRSRDDPRLSSSGGADTPDFYFMPSQRKYSGEVVRVFVDYNKDPKH